MAGIGQLLDQLKITIQAIGRIFDRGQNEDFICRGQGHLNDGPLEIKSVTPNTGKRPVGQLRYMPYMVILKLKERGLDA